MNARTIIIASVAVFMLFVMVMPAAADGIIADGIIIPEPICPPQPELQQPCLDCARPPIRPCPPVPPPLGSTPLSVKYQSHRDD